AQRDRRATREARQAGGRAMRPPPQRNVVAQEMRAVLARTFPGTKFSARQQSRARVSRFVVAWSDGPSEDDKSRARSDHCPAASRSARSIAFDAPLPTGSRRDDARRLRVAGARARRDRDRAGRRSGGAARLARAAMEGTVGPVCRTKIVTSPGEPW